MRRVYQENGYLEVRTPQVIDRSLWERSGHWAKYRANMFTTESENRYYALKPMNCPGHIQLFNSALRSYRDLPLRMAEFGKVNRYEASGALMGLMRVREFTQDDAHIFCTPEQMEEECITTMKLIFDIYKDFGFDKIKIYLSTVRKSVSVPTKSGIFPKSRWRAHWKSMATSMKSTKARALSTVRSWNSSSATPSAANGSAAQFRST